MSQKKDKENIKFSLSQSPSLEDRVNFLVFNWPLLNQTTREKKDEFLSKGCKKCSLHPAE